MFRFTKFTVIYYFVSLVEGLLLTPNLVEQVHEGVVDHESDGHVQTDTR